jgi:hypothetical protein
MAFGDVDNDATQIPLASNNEPTHLLINNLGHQKHCLGLRMVGEKSIVICSQPVSRFSARVVLRFGEEYSLTALTQRPTILGSYSGWEIRRNSQRYTYWVSRRVEEWTGVAPHKYTTLREGSVKPVT